MIGYIGSLFVMLVAAFWQVDALSGEVSRTFTIDNFKEIVDTPVYRSVTFRTVGIAAAATRPTRCSRSRSRSTWRRSRAPA